MAQDRDQLLQRAVDTWISRLLDMTGNNRLIFYRELKQGTLNLEKAIPSLIEKLHADKEVLVSELFGASKTLDPRLVEEFGGEEQFLAHLERVNKKALAVYNKWRIYHEEKGISILRLAKDFLTWPIEGNKGQPSAPMLLAPLDISPVSAARSDFRIKKVDDWIVNETLLQFLDQSFGSNLSKTFADDTSPPFDKLLRAIKAAIPGTRFTHVDTQVIGNFTYTRLPMVKDLQSNIELLRENDLIAAIAGDQEAALKVRTENSVNPPDLSDPNYVAPVDEFLVLDADSSQNYVINASVNGRSLVVQGPPGTGKSQTIANAIASLTARGKSVLFVAEKRAAIEAVSKRLTRVGLGGMLMDLHAKEIKAKELAKDIQETLGESANVPSADFSAAHKSLVQHRSALLSYDKELHEARLPWDYSYFEVNEKILEHESDSSIRLSKEFTATLTGERLEHIEARVREWAEARQQIDWNSHWNAASISSGDEGRSLVEVVDDLLIHKGTELHRTLNRLGRDFERNLDELSIEGLAALIDLGEQIDRTEKVFEAGVRHLDLKAVITDLNQSYFSAEKRAARSQLRQVKKTFMRPSKLKAAVTEAIRIKKVWDEHQFGGQPNATLHSEELEKNLGDFNSFAAFLAVAYGDELARLSFAEVMLFLETLDGQRNMAIHLGGVADLETELTGLGLCELIRETKAQNLENEASKIFLYSAFKSINKQLVLDHPHFASFSSEAHNGNLNNFVDSDLWHQESTVHRIKRLVAERATAARNKFPDQALLLEKESKKKTKHKSFRVLQEQAPDVLTSLKPCWMMSPLMVSQVLPPIALFDFVIFDEASQIRPEDAVCAIARGKQTVVAGDDRQLPPSKFFDGGDDDSEEEEEDEVEEALTKGYESILDVTSVILPQRMLEWHYRSRDERLIALSNSHIYKGALTTFPGSMTESPIQWHYIDHMPTSDGETTSNATEVNKVVDLVLDHAQQYLADDGDTNVDEGIDQETLGVIAFGQPHATAIENELYSRLKHLRNPRLDDFFDSERPEPFFVKNLERVQGDERDCIILSIGYGKNSNGVVPQRFGPINQQGGERRVNVAVSRARSKMTVVSSIQESDITNESSNKGRSILKALLKFAKSKGNDVGIEGNQVPLNAFELRVLNELEDLDLTVIPQYGVGKFRIDFAVADPENMNKMVLAVEADGATYHSSPTARDRDRLRQQVLEDKGWRFVRIWSTDFFKDPKAEARRVHTALQRALRGEEDLVDADEQGPGLSAGNAPTTHTQPYLTKPYLTKSQPVQTYDPQQLVAMVNWITQGGEKLLTDEDINSQMMEELGYKKRGSKILEHFDLAIKRSRGEIAIPSGEATLKGGDSPRSPTKKQAAKKKNSSKSCSCGGRIVRRTGPHGTFYGCSNYPRCRKTRNTR